MLDRVQNAPFPKVAQGTAAAILAHVPATAPEELWPAILSDAERRRAQAFHNPIAKAEFCCARTLLRFWLSSILNISPLEVPIRIGPHGAPILAPPYHHLKFNLSHAAGKVMLAVADGGMIGVDLEVLEPCDTSLDLARMVMPDREVALLTRLHGSARMHAFVRLWTRREAVLKYRGCGFAGNDRALSMLGRRNDPVLHEGCEMGLVWCIASSPDIWVAPIRTLVLNELH
ncbi:phosphopantetheinyl transferase [Undibacterium sp. GrIS 1.2]